MKDSSETPTIGVKGVLIYNHATERHVFRVYTEEGKDGFVDYKLAAEDIWIELQDKYCSLFQCETNRIDYSSAYLGRGRRILDDMKSQEEP